MSDLKKYVAKRKASDKEFAEGYEEGLENFKIGVLLRQAREKSGITQEAVAKKLRTNKSAISRIENHSEDIRFIDLAQICPGSRPIDTPRNRLKKVCMI